MMQSSILWNPSSTARHNWNQEFNCKTKCDKDNLKTIQAKFQQFNNNNEL